MSDVAKTCPSPEDLSAFHDGELSPQESARVEAHVSSCADCAKALARLRRASGLLGALPRETAPEDLVRSVAAHARAQDAGRRAPKWVLMAIPLASAAAVVALSFAVLRYAQHEVKLESSLSFALESAAKAPAQQAPMPDPAAAADARTLDEKADQFREAEAQPPAAGPAEIQAEEARADGYVSSSPAPMRASKLAKKEAPAAAPAVAPAPEPAFAPPPPPAESADAPVEGGVVGGVVGGVLGGTLGGSLSGDLARTQAAPATPGALGTKQAAEAATEADAEDTGALKDSASAPARDDASAPARDDSSAPARDDAPARANEAAARAEFAPEPAKGAAKPAAPVTAGPAAAPEALDERKRQEVTAGLGADLVQLPASAATPMAITADVVPPVLITRVEPEMPIQARRDHASGEVILSIIVDEAGGVRLEKIIRSVPIFDQAAINAVVQWRYKPAIYQGHPQAVRLIVRVKMDAR